MGQPKLRPNKRHQNSRVNSAHTQWQHHYTPVTSEPPQHRDLLLFSTPQVQGTAKGKTAKAVRLLQDPNDPLPDIVPGMGGFYTASSQTGSHTDKSSSII